jgi:hypothetical protein
MASWGVTLAKAAAIALIRAGCVRAWALRREALILLHIFSMGLNSPGVGRQEEDLSSSLRNQREGRLTFMWGEVVHDDHIALAQGRAQDAAHIGAENLRVGSPFDGHAGGGTVQAHRADHGGSMPMAVGAAGMDALSPQGTAAQAGQVGLRPRFVQKDQPGWIEAELAPPPRPARPRDVGAVLLAGPERLFLYVSPILSSA